MNNLLCGALCLALMPTPAIAEDQGGTTVADLHTRCDDVGGVNEAWCLGFITGMTNLAIESGIACPVTQISYGDMEANIVKAMVKHPELADQSASIFLMAAMSAWFPCKDDKQPSDNSTRHDGGSSI